MNNRLLRFLFHWIKGEIPTWKIAFKIMLRLYKSGFDASHDAAVELLKIEKKTPSLEAFKIGRDLAAINLPEGYGFQEPAVPRRTNPVANTWIFQNKYTDWNIQEGELVLDVGSGGWPFQRADHLADKFPEKTSHRSEKLIRDGRPFFEVDLEKLPFVNKAYDFVFCSHVLEHIDDPGQAMRELMRIGKRGYIELPTRLSDVMFNFTRIPNHHKWHGLVMGQTVILMEWVDSERRDLGNYFFEQVQSDFLNDSQNFFEKNRDIFFASLHWESSFDFKVINKEGRIIDSTEGLSERYE